MSAPSSAVRPPRAPAATPRKSEAPADTVAEESVAAQSPVHSANGFNGNRRVPTPVNEAVKSYAPGSAERTALKDRLRSMSNETIDIPLIIGGEENWAGGNAHKGMPHKHRPPLARWHSASETGLDP